MNTGSSTVLSKTATRFVTWADAWSNSPPSANLETKVRARAVFMLSIVYAITTIGIMIAAQLTDYGSAFTFGLGIVALIGVLGAFILLRKDPNPGKAGAFVSITLTIAIIAFLPISGGLESPIMVMLVLVPVSWALLISVRSAAFATVALLVFIFGAAILVHSGHADNDAHLSQEAFAVVFLLAAVLSGGVTTTGYGMMMNYALKKAQENSREAEHLAAHDQLTGLPNRHAYYQKAAKFTNKDFVNGVVFYGIDLNKFKTINDTYGHFIGDQVLQIAAQRLKSLLRDRDWLARMGGDEFTLISKSNNHPAESYEMASRILRKLSEPYQVEELSLSLTASVGIACSPEHGTSINTLSNHADLALFAAKEQSQRNWRMFDARLQEDSIRRRDIERRLRLAIQNGQLDVQYQPFVDNVKNTVVGFEALARWTDAELGVVSPSEFIAVAEKCGLIADIGDYVLRRACHDATAWRYPSHLPAPRIAVNVSPHQFSSKQFPRMVEDILESYSLEPSRLELEITETALMSDTSRAIQGLNALDKLGVSVAVDDFGTGYSSLSYLKLFPIDRLKIDRSFIRDIEYDSNDLAIVKAVLGLAKSMELDVIAEGIETIEQAEILRQMGCYEMQGFLFARSMVRSEVQDFLNSFGIAAPGLPPATIAQKIHA